MELGHLDQVVDLHRLVDGVRGAQVRVDVAEEDGANPYATVPQAERTQWESVNPAESSGSSSAPGTRPATYSASAA